MIVERYTGGDKKDKWYITSRYFNIVNRFGDDWCIIDLDSNDLLHLSEFFKQRWEESMSNIEPVNPEDIKF